MRVRVAPAALADWYYPLAGDAETALLIEPCAAGRVPPAVLADRIDEIEPADPVGPVLRVHCGAPRARPGAGGVLRRERLRRKSAPGRVDGSEYQPGD